MNEELNQVQENTVTESDNIFDDSTSVEENEGLFDDYESEDTPVETTEESEDTEVEEVPQQDDGGAPQENPFGLKIKYNGEEQVLDEETARTLAQKGMNYDRFYEPIERLARMNGMSVGDYLNRLNDTQIQYEVSKEIDALRENPRYDGVSDEVLEEIATNHVMENIGNQDRRYEQEMQSQADARQAEVERSLELFFQEYPEFRDKGPDAVDPKVFEYVKNGYTLLEAYNKWSREQEIINRPKIEAKQKTSQLNEANKKKSLGNTTNAGSTEADDFLSGLFSD